MHFLICAAKYVYSKYVAMYDAWYTATYIYYMRIYLAANIPSPAT